MTGATGFIGSNLVRKLRTNEDYGIIALARGQSDMVIERRNVKIVTCDILDRDRLKEATKGVDVVIHLAALKAHYESRESIIATNVQGTRNLLECSKDVKQFIFASSTLASNPLDAYSESKKECEQVTQKSGINFTILRIGPVFGSGDTTNLTKLIELIQNGKTIPIPGDGKQVIQPTHVDDVVEAIERVIMNSDLFNKTRVIAGKPITLALFMDSISRVLKKKSKGIRIPVGILKPMVRVYQKVSASPKITVEQLNNLGKGTTNDVFESDFPTSALEVAIQKTSMGLP